MKINLIVRQTSCHLKPKMPFMFALTIESRDWSRNSNCIVMQTFTFESGNRSCYSFPQEMKARVWPLWQLPFPASAYTELRITPSIYMISCRVWQVQHFWHLEYQHHCYLRDPPLWTTQWMQRKGHPGITAESPFSKITSNGQKFRKLSERLYGSQQKRLKLEKSPNTRLAMILISRVDPCSSSFFDFSVQLDIYAIWVILAIVSWILKSRSDRLRRQAPRCFCSLQGSRFWRWA